MRSLRRSAAFALVSALLLLAIDSRAQQPATGRKRTPSLTTEDVVRPRTDQTVESAGQPVAAKSDATKPQAGSDKVDPEEAAWRERVRHARQRAEEIERKAEETELRVTELRNALGVSGQSARYRNNTAAELEQTGKQLLELRAQAREAASDLEKLLQYGREKGFAEEAGPKPTSDDGKPNEEYYRIRFAKLNEELQTALRRAELYENRVRDLNLRINLNSGSGDNFYIAQLQQERDEAQQKMNEARSARDRAQQEIAALREEARRAGLPPGIFRN
ncbi:MAG TPA: hypothetical protein VNO14_06925 [Blastocatellia bacterium]|nr:hypothetical protein [Blastocatellia bacterium]